MLKWTEKNCPIHNLYIIYKYIYFIILVRRDSCTLIRSASRNMGKHGGKSACCTVCVCVCVFLHAYNVYLIVVLVVSLLKAFLFIVLPVLQGYIFVWLHTNLAWCFYIHILCFSYHIQHFWWPSASAVYHRSCHDKNGSDKGVLLSLHQSQSMQTSSVAHSLTL